MDEMDKMVLNGQQQSLPAVGCEDGLERVTLNILKGDGIVVPCLSLM